MELLWIIAPFFVFASIGIMALKKYKNRSNTEEVKEASFLQRQSFYPYLSLLLFTKSSFRKPETNIYYWIFLIAFLCGMTSLYFYSGYTVVSLDEMRIQEGKVTHIQVIRRSPSIASLLTKKGNVKYFSLYTTENKRQRLINRDVKFWYIKSKGIRGAKNKVYQVYQNDKPFHVKGDRYWVYDQKSRLELKKKFLLVGVILLLGSFGSLLILWILNRK